MAYVFVLHPFTNRFDVFFECRLKMQSQLNAHWISSILPIAEKSIVFSFAFIQNRFNLLQTWCVCDLSVILCVWGLSVYIFTPKSTISVDNLYCPESQLKRSTAFTWDTFYVSQSEIMWFLPIRTAVIRPKNMVIGKGVVGFFIQCFFR